MDHLLTVIERVGALDAKAASAHARIDEMKATMEKLSTSVNELVAVMNRGKGWIAAALFFGTGIGSVVGWVFSHK